MKSENDVEGLGIILMKLNDYYLGIESFHLLAFKMK